MAAPALSSAPRRVVPSVQTSYGLLIRPRPANVGVSMPKRLSWWSTKSPASYRIHCALMSL